MSRMSSRRPNYRFAFDLGTHSIGWAVFEIDDKGALLCLVDAGVRIFDDSRDPKDAKPLGERRRIPRSARRRRDRFLQRRQKLMSMLLGFGLIPEDAKARKALAEVDPYHLRGEALDRPLAPHEIGRVLIHLNQRRGFKSNRKTDTDAGDEKGKIASAAERLEEKMKAANARTFGEFLWQRHRGPDGKASPRNRQPVRIRLEGQGRDALYNFYPTRHMLESEFDAIMAAQRGYNPNILTDERIALLRNEIFFQRPLKTPKRGKCTFIPSEERLPRTLPSVEERVAYEAVNNLRFGVGVRIDTKLTGEQRDKIVGLLLEGKIVKLTRLRKVSGAPADAHFQFAAGEDKGLKDYVAESAKKLSAADAFGAAWHDFSLQRKDEIVGRLIGDEDDDSVRDWLITTQGLSPEAARKVTTLSFRVGTASLGKTANDAVLEQLRSADVPTYSDAVKRAGEARGEIWHHSDLDNPKPRDFLPYYAQVLERQVLPGSDAPGDNPYEAYHGKIANPTVHRCLRQLAKLTNALIRKYAKPTQVVIELARDLKLGEKQKDEHRKRNRKNREANDERKLEIEKQHIPVTADSLLRLRLYDEQARSDDGVALCPYSLKVIEREQVFSDLVEIDHILPYSRTLDDSPANKVLCFREANRDKRNRAPYEAFGPGSKGGNATQWAKIESYASTLAKNKSWRFSEDAMQRFENDERGFAERQLNETRYISRLARAYLATVAGRSNVYVTTGQLTAMLRRRWGLNQILRNHNQPEDEPARKVRDDHRHHAVDAIVIGAIDRGLLNEMSRRAGAYEGEGRNWRITEAAPDEPCSDYAETAKSIVRSIIVSRKPDHGKGGALHEETAYGIVHDEVEAALIGNLVTRKPVTALSAGEVDSVRDRPLREALQEAVAPFRDARGKVRDEKGFRAALQTFSEQRNEQDRRQGVRRVRIGKKQNDFVPVRDRRTGGVYKALIAGENHHMDIVQMREGDWQAFAATRFEVNQKDWRPPWERQKLGGKLVMRVHKGDVIAIEDRGAKRYMSVHRLSPSNNVLYLAEHFEGGSLGKRHNDGNDLFRWDFASVSSLKARKARLVHVDILGKVSVRRSNVG